MEKGDISPVLGVLNIFLGFLGFLLNLWFIVTFIKHKSVRQMQNIILCGLSVSDLFRGILVQVTYGIRLILVLFNIYQHYCWMRAITLSSNMIFSLLTFTILTAMSVERYLAVFKAQFYSCHVTKRFLTVTVLLLWITVTILATVSLATHSLYTKISTLVYGVPLLLAVLWNIYAYIQIFLHLKRINRQVSGLEHRLHGHGLSVDQARRSYKCLAVLLVFVICYIPYLLGIIVQGQSGQNQQLQSLLIHVTFTVANCNSCINPCLHFMASLVIRSKMIAIIRQRKTEFK